MPSITGFSAFASIPEEQVSDKISRRIVSGEQGMIGMIGIARSPLTPQGKVFVNGELWNAVALAPVKSGQAVRVRSIHGLTVEVEPETPQATAPVEG